MTSPGATWPSVTRPAVPRDGVPWVSMARPGVARPRPLGRGPGRLPRAGQHRSAPAALQVRLARWTGGEDLVGPLAFVGQAGDGQAVCGQPPPGQRGVLGPAYPVPGRRRIVLAG